MITREQMQVLVAVQQELMRCARARAEAEYMEDAYRLVTMANQLSYVGDSIAQLGLVERIYVGTS